jgi:hypothetical protein
MPRVWQAAGAAPFAELLHTHQPLAARFPAVITFPGYTPAQLTAIFTSLAAEAGLTLTPEAASRAATVLAQAEAGPSSGSARLAARLLALAAGRQGLRLAGTGSAMRPAWLPSAQTRSPLPSHPQLPGPAATGPDSTCDQSLRP